MVIVVDYIHRQKKLLKSGETRMHEYPSQRIIKGTKKLILMPSIEIVNNIKRDLAANHRKIDIIGRYELTSYKHLRRILKTFPDASDEPK